MISSSSPRIVALVGPKRCGKDTVASFMAGFGYANMKLSHRLKKICIEMFGFTDEEIESSKKDDVHPRWGVTPRRIMQVFGTEIAQFQFQANGIPSIGRTIWVERLAEDLAAMAPHEKAVITDMRFMHEYQYLYERFHQDMVVVKLIRTYENSQAPQPTDADSHVSEQEWMTIPADIIVLNDSSIHAMNAKIANVLRLNQN